MTQQITHSYDIPRISFVTIQSKYEQIQYFCKIKVACSSCYCSHPLSVSIQGKHSRMADIHYNRKCTFQIKWHTSKKHLQTVTSTLWSHFKIIQFACALHGGFWALREVMPAKSCRPKIRLKISSDLTQANQRTVHVTPYVFLYRLNRFKISQSFPTFNCTSSGWHYTSRSYQKCSYSLEKQISACCFRYFQTTLRYSHCFLFFWHHNGEMKQHRVWAHLLCNFGLKNMCDGLQKTCVRRSQASITPCSDCMQGSILNETLQLQQIQVSVQIQKSWRELGSS